MAKNSISTYRIDDGLIWEVYVSWYVNYYVKADISSDMSNTG